LCEGRESLSPNFLTFQDPRHQSHGIGKLVSDSIVDPDPGSGAFLIPGFGIRCLFDPWIRDPGWIKNQDPDPGSGMNNPGSYFLELKNHFLGLKYYSLMRIQDPDPGWKKFGSGILDPGWKKVGSRIRKNIPDPQHWFQNPFTFLLNSNYYICRRKFLHSLKV
jgi:hypothetical protein